MREIKVQFAPDVQLTCFILFCTATWKCTKSRFILNEIVRCREADLTPCFTIKKQVEKCSIKASYQLGSMQ